MFFDGVNQKVKGGCYWGTV